MKKTFLIAGIAAMTIVACKKDATTTPTENDSIANAELDTVNQKMDSLGDAIDASATVTEDAVKDAATATTEQGIDNAKGAVKDANEVTEKAADKAKDAAADAKDAVKNATK